MKTLMKHTIPVLVILIWVVLAVIISLSSCTKDSPQIISGATPAPSVQDVALAGPDIDLALNAYSSYDPVTSFDLTIDRKMVQSFSIQHNENMKWHIEHLGSGTHRINIFTRLSTYPSSGFCNFQFNITNGSESKTVNATKIDPTNYAFNLLIQ